LKNIKRETVYKKYGNILIRNEERRNGLKTTLKRRNGEDISWNLEGKDTEIKQRKETEERRRSEKRNREK